MIKFRAGEFKEFKSTVVLHKMQLTLDYYTRVFIIGTYYKIHFSISYKISSCNQKVFGFFLLSQETIFLLASRLFSYPKFNYQTTPNPLKLYLIGEKKSGLKLAREKYSHRPIFQITHLFPTKLL